MDGCGALFSGAVVRGTPAPCFGGSFQAQGNYETGEGTEQGTDPRAAVGGGAAGNAVSTLGATKGERRGFPMYLMLSFSLLFSRFVHNIPSPPKTYGPSLSSARNVL